MEYLLMRFLTVILPFGMFLPDTIQFSNGNQIVHTYDAAGNRLRTSYYTRKVTTIVPLGNTLPVGTKANYHIVRDAFHRNCFYYDYGDTNSNYGIEFVRNTEGYVRYYFPEEYYHFYYIRDHQGNIRETYVRPRANYKECIQRLQYYPSGLPWNVNYVPSEQPYKYGGKEFVERYSTNAVYHDLKFMAINDKACLLHKHIAL